MKKIIKIFLFLFVFFIININVLALGVSKDAISNNIDNNYYDLSAGDYLCVYKSQDESEYIAIKFDSINSNRYDLIFYIASQYGTTYHFNDYGALPSNLKHDSEKVYLTSAPNCSDYIFYYSVTEPYYTIYSITELGGQIEKNDMIFDSELSKLDIQEDDELVTQTPSTELYILIQGEKYYYVEDTDYVSHFESAKGIWACYVETNSTNDLSYVAKNIPLDFNFNDSNLVVQIDSNSICNDGYIILKETYTNDGIGATLEGSNNITLIDKFVPDVYKKNVYVQVYENAEGIIVQLNGNQRISVENINKYKSIYLNKQEENYPKYLIFSNNKYYFSNYKNLDNDNSINLNYIADIKLQNKFITNKLAPTDTIYISLKKIYASSDFESEVLSTCQEVFGLEFLKFLENNVFKIVYIGIPIILILLTSFDFAKVVFVDDKDGIQNAFKKLKTRIIVAILIFLVPTILIFVSNLIGSEDIDTCVKYFNDMKDSY